MTGALELAVSLVSDQDGRRLGDLWVDWQHTDARAVLAPTDGEPRQHWLSRPKGGSKDTDVAAFVLGWLVEEAGPFDDAYVIGADEDQGNRLLDRARGFVRRSRLGAVVKVEATSIVSLRNGARVHALAADVPGGEGLLSPFIVVEELPNWAESASALDMWTLAVSSIPKWPGMRFVVIGHAGSPAHFSFRALEHARASDLWHVHEIAGPLPWISKTALAEQRAMLPESAFRRRHLNEWRQPQDAALSRDDVVACVSHTGPLEPGPFRYLLTVDLGWRRDRTALCVAHRDGDRVVVDRLETFQGTRRREVSLQAVEVRVADLARTYGATVWCDPAQAVLLMQRLRASGLSVKEHTFSATSNTRLALRLLELVKAHRLAIPDDDALVDELVSIRIVERGPGMFRVDHSAGTHDDMVVVVGMGCVHLAEQSVGGSGTSAQAARSLPQLARGGGGSRIGTYVDPRMTWGVRRGA